uniref:histidine kinase n=1 Tax=Candidatus Kentrum sp. UNK TaxID=2126344 RepID=A0A450ZYJ0_9GAMM|nr:MAG: His Kinase A (phospho-acceptor) domain-containing protein [Candidatus Kentron sp. UNK]VFK68600.1 MAG: His Kinase A (phospho-acceptor) domain-containing protein [Candidatus Kentron sp. UNK]
MVANRTETSEKSYDVFIEYEQTGESFSLKEIAEKVGWVESTVRTYLSKKWDSFILRNSDGKYRVEGLGKLYTLEEYLQLMTQTEKSLRRELGNKQTALLRSQQVASLGVMASGLAHEIMQPVQVILTTAQNCREDARESGLDAPFLGEDLERIIHRAERIDSIINHLRMLSREQAPRPEALTLEIVVGEVFSLFDQQLKTHGVRAERQFPPELPPIFMDPVQLEQVFINLITNAREALERSEGDEKAITVRAEARGEGVEVIFSNTGEGIASDQVDKVFEPFVTTKEKGVGLGLYITRDILQSYGGAIRAENAPGRGAIFTLRLPVYRGEDAEIDR